MMERIPNAIYTKELREEAVKLVIESGLSAPEVGRRLSIAPSTLQYWVKAYKKGALSGVGKQRKSLTEIEMELLQVKRELAEVKMERDILKKAAAYFARGSLPGTRS
jgi:transposase